MKILIILSSLFFVLFSNAISAKNHTNCSKHSPLTFGILPFVSAEQLVIRFTPLVNYLSEHLNTPIRIETAPNFIEFNRRTNQQQRYDILFTAPHFFPPASKVGYHLIASVDSPGMRAVIVVPKNSKIKKISDLKGTRLATVDAKSMATLLVKKHLRHHNINPETDLTMVATPTHDASLLSSYHGVTDASALMQPPYEAATKLVRDSMRIIAKTQRSPHIPISVKSNINSACADEITELLLGMNTTEEGQAVLKHNRFSGFKKTDISQYKNIEALMSQP